MQIRKSRGVQIASGISSINGLISAGANITITGSGTLADPYVINSSGGGGANITVVANYTALPAPSTVSGLFYWCSSNQGTAWLPGTLGGTYYSAGLYYSNGTSWEYLIVPYQATQGGVNAEIISDQFVTPNTLGGWFTQKLLTGYTIGANTAILATDTILQAFGKSQAQINAKANIAGQVFTGVISATNLSGTNTGDQTITLTGDVTGSGTGSFVTTIANNVVTLAKMAQVATRRLLGRITAGTGNVEALTIDQMWTLLSNTTDNTGSGTLSAISTSDLNSLRFTNAPTIRGFANGASGKNLIILNDHATNSITLNNEDVVETAANRIVTGGQNILIPAKCLAKLVYNTTNSRWNVEAIHGNVYFPTLAGTGSRVMQVDSSGNGSSGGNIVSLFQFAQTTDVTVTAASLTSILTGTIIGTTTILSSSDATNPMFVVGKTYRGYVSGVFSSLVSATFQTRILIGGTTLIDTGALTMVANTTKGFRIEYDFTVRTTGVSGTISPNLRFEIDGQAPFITTASSVTIDTTANRILDIQVAYGATNASNTVTVRQSKCIQDAN